MTDIEEEHLRNFLKANPRKAFQLLCDRYYKKMRRLAFFLTWDETAAKDIAHDAYLATLAKREELSRGNIKSIDNYMAKIVRFMAADYHKRKRHLDIDELLLGGDLSEDNERDNIVKDMIADMRAQIATYTSREQECMLMKLDHDMSLDEIAAELKVSRKLVEKNQTSALKKLKEWGRGYWKIKKNN